MSKYKYITIKLLTIIIAIAIFSPFACASVKVSDLPFKEFQSRNISGYNSIGADSGQPTGWIIEYDESIRSANSFSKMNLSDNCKIKRLMPGIGLIQFSDDADIPSVLAELAEHPSVISIEPDYKRYLMDEPNDEYYDEQWALQNIEAVSAWGLAGSPKKSAVVGVIDSGVDSSHPDLKNRALTGIGYRNGEAISDTTDTLGHGTAVAGIIAAEMGNSIGISGVAGNYDIKVLPIKVFWDKNYANSSDVISAIDYAITQGVDVINLSLGSDIPSVTEEKAIKRALDAGIVVVASAGNNGDSSYSYPASYSGVLSVGAIKENDKRALFSNYNDKVSIVAPGYRVLSTSLNGAYGLFDGTSFSAPYVSGIAAFLMANDPFLENKDINKILMQTSVDLGVKGRDPYYGFGKVNFNNALKYVMNSGEEPGGNIINGPIPVGTVVIGNKAYDLNYANNPANADEIRKAIVESNGIVYIKKFNGSWINNNTGGSVQPVEIPFVEHKDADGNIAYYRDGDGTAH